MTQVNDPQVIFWSCELSAQVPGDVGVWAGKVKGQQCNKEVRVHLGEFLKGVLKICLWSILFITPFPSFGPSQLVQGLARNSLKNNPGSSGGAALGHYPKAIVAGRSTEAATLFPAVLFPSVQV